MIEALSSTGTRAFTCSKSATWERMNCSSEAQRQDDSREATMSTTTPVWSYAPAGRRQGPRAEQHCLTGPFSRCSFPPCPTFAGCFCLTLPGPQEHLDLYKSLPSSFNSRFSFSTLVNNLASTPSPQETELFRLGFPKPRAPGKIGERKHVADRIRWVLLVGSQRHGEVQMTGELRQSGRGQCGQKQGLGFPHTKGSSV